MRASQVLRYVAFVPMALFGFLGTLFVAGYAFEDPGGWAAVAVTAAWVVPMVGLSVFALLRPGPASTAFRWLTPLVLLVAVLDDVFGILPEDDWGPVTAISVFAFGVTLAFLGLHRPRLAGLLMVTAAAVQFVAIAVGFAVRDGGEGPGARAMLGGSSGIVVLPLLVVGALFMLAGSLDGEQVHLRRPRTPRAAH